MQLFRLSGSKVGCLHSGLGHGQADSSFQNIEIPGQLLARKNVSSELRVPDVLFKSTQVPLGGLQRENM